MKIAGRCYCGALRYHATGDPLFKGQCHCRECQYISGGHPNVWLAMPATGLTYVKGTPKQFRHSDFERPVTRDFCGDCGTHILTRSPRLPDGVLLKVGTLDDPSVYGGPLMVVWTSEKHSFHTIPDGIATFERFPG